MDVSYIDFEPDKVEEIDSDDIDLCDDGAKLARWYSAMDELYDHIRFFVDERRFAGVADPEWFEAASGKLVYLRKGKRRVENKMLSLGLSIPYQPSDPRTRQIQKLETKLKKLKQILQQNGISIVEVEEAA